MTTQAQKNYIIQRITALTAEKIKEANAVHLQKAKLLTPAQIATDIKNGKIKQRKTLSSYVSGYLSDYFEVPSPTPTTQDRKDYDEACRKINVEAGRIKDEVMLGDCTEALKLIRQFENMKV